jgi:hypothetical protein
MKIKGKSRHFYDIYRISQTEYANKALADKELYMSIVAHRERFTKITGVDYASHFPPNLNPIPSLELMLEWERDYAAIHEQMIVEDDVTFEMLLNTLKRICEKINGVCFTIQDSDLSNELGT